MNVQEKNTEELIMDAANKSAEYLKDYPYQPGDPGYQNNPQELTQVLAGDAIGAAVVASGWNLYKQRARLF